MLRAGAPLVVFQALAGQAFAEDARIARQNGDGAETRAALPSAIYQPGFIDAFGRFMEESAAKLNSQLKNAHDTLGGIGNQTSGAAKGAVDTAKGAADAAKGAADAIIGLPNARIVTGKEPCARSANGAPDCRAAADAACRGKGFASGKSLDTQTTQKCPARVWLSGRLPADGDCALETFVTRAVCQ